MTIKKCLLGDETRSGMFKGFKIVEEAVGATAGPGGRCVGIQESYGSPKITKDGVTVAQSIALKGIVGEGAKLIIQASETTARDAGDGPQPLWSKILTPTGWTTMGEIKKGDVICGTNGTIQTVEDVFDKGKRTIYKVCFRDGSIVECCEDHLWTVYTGQNKYYTKPLKELIGKKQIQVPYSFVEMKERQVLIDPYLIGVLIGDGSMHDNSSIEICIGLKKQHILDKLVLPDDCTLTIKEYSNNIRVKFHSNILKNELIRLGLYNTYSDNKFIPDDYLFNTVENRKKLLQGLSDTDGHINKKGLIEYSTISIKLADNVASLMKSLGMYINRQTQIKKSGYNPGQTIYRVSELKGCKWGLPIKNIIKADEETDMRCILVSNPDHLYVTDNYILTHNTTATCILARAIAEEGLKAISKGRISTQIKKGIDDAAKEVASHLDSISKKVDGSTQIKQVATISANGDETVGQIISDAIDQIGTDGVITVEDSRSLDTTIEIVEGLRIDKGYLSPYFMNKPEKQMVEYDDPYIFLYDGKINTLKSILHLLEAVAQSGRPLVIIADDVDNEPLSTLVVNNLRGGLKVCAIKAPAFGDIRKFEMEDIAVLTGGKFISQSFGTNLENLDLSIMGSCSKIKITAIDTIIIGGYGEQSAIDERVKQIKGEIETTESEYDREKLRERLAKLTGGVAVIRVGGSTETEVNELKDRIDDAIKSTRAALEEGVLPGGGSSLLSFPVPALTDSDYDTGRAILYNSLTAPLKKIANNAGYIADVVVEKVRENADNIEAFGFDARNNIYGNMYAMGIIDATKVVKSALLNGSSVASLLLTTEGYVLEDDEETKKQFEMMNQMRQMQM